MKESYADAEEGLNTIRKRQLSGDLGKPEDVANAALFLASDESKFMITIEIDRLGRLTNRLG